MGSFIFSVLTVRWYTKRFNIRKDKHVETADEPLKATFESSEDSADIKLPPKAKRVVKSVLNQKKEDEKMYTELYNDLIVNKKQQ